jgi:hypothetical protein
MALAGVLPAIATQLRTAGFVEWKDAFPTDNIPATILDRSFHIGMGTVSSAAANQRAHVFRMPITVQVLRRGFRDAHGMRESCMIDADTVLSSLLAPSFRLSIVDDVKDLSPLSVDLDPISSSNDNDFILTIRFEALIISLF